MWLYINVYNDLIYLITCLLTNLLTQENQFNIYNYTLKKSESNYTYFQIIYQNISITEYSNKLKLNNTIEDLNISPNPFTSSFQIEFKNDQKYSVKLYASTGLLILEHIYSGIQTLELGNELPTGMYLLQINSEDESKTFKIIKK